MFALLGHRIVQKCHSKVFGRLGHVHVSSYLSLCAMLMKSCEKKWRGWNNGLICFDGDCWWWEKWWLQGLWLRWTTPHAWDEDTHTPKGMPNLLETRNPIPTWALHSCYLHQISPPTCSLRLISKVLSLNTNLYYCVFKKIQYIS